MIEQLDLHHKTSERQIDTIITTLGENTPRRGMLELYRPQDEWFLRGPEGVHGVTHETRVLVWQEILAALQTEEIQTSLNREALRWAATTHDLRRQDDGVDREHGIRSADWVRENLATQLPEETLRTVLYVNTWHVPPDHKSPAMTKELAIFKDADALDRWRLEDSYPGVITFIDARKLRHGETKSLLVLPAKVLYDKTKNKKVQDFDSILDSAEELGIIQK